MRLAIILFLPILLVIGCLAFTATAQPDAGLKEKLAAMAREYFEQRRAVGIAIGILDREGKEHHFAFGLVSKDSREEPNENTLFELGSVTKCFTAILLAEMIEKGEVHLQDPAEKYLPRGSMLPRVGGRPMTLEELVTYSTGLPRMPANFGRNEREHEHYSNEKMLEFLKELAHKERGGGPQRHYLYSNLGFGLLGLCLAERAREPARPLIINRVCRPLGMESTFFEPPESVRRRVAKVYSKEGKPVPPWETGAIAPAGMLRSTTKDMVRFLAANTGRMNTPLAKAIQMTHKPLYQTGTSEQHPTNHPIGMAWFIDPTTGFIQHDGATGGSSSNLVFDPKTKCGVVVLMNQEHAPVINMSMRIMHLLHGQFDLPRYPQTGRSDLGEGP